MSQAYILKRYLMGLQAVNRHTTTGARLDPWLRPLLSKLDVPVGPPEVDFNQMPTPEATSKQKRPVLRYCGSDATSPSPRKISCIEHALGLQNVVDECADEHEESEPSGADHDVSSDEEGFGEAAKALESATPTKNGN